MLRAVALALRARLRRFGGFASFSYWRSHPSSRGGEFPRSNVTANYAARAQLMFKRQSALLEAEAAAARAIKDAEDL